MKKKIDSRLKITLWLILVFCGVICTLAALNVFLPMLVTGTLAVWIPICLLAGILLIALEVFVFPGFGITGISGAILVAASLIGACLTSDPTNTVDFPSLGTQLIIIGIGCVAATALILFLTSSRGPEFLRKGAALETELKARDGFVGVDMKPAGLVGKNAVAVTDLRPSGKINIDGTVYDAVSCGPFVSAGKDVKVVRYENAQLYVEKT